ncbi:MAG: methionyl-tRNA formyltransferase [Pseudomonadales bacterium]
MTAAPAPLRIIFAGTPDFAAKHLDYLLTQGFNIIAVYTQPDRPAKRGKRLTASPVKTLALTQQIPVFQPESLRNQQAQDELEALEADIMVVVAYGLILPQVVLDTPKLGCINVHASLLPRWRGAAPIERAIAAGDERSGITIMQMDAGLDTGAMLDKVYCDISAGETGDSLRQKLAIEGGPALVRVLGELAKGPTSGEIQDDSLSNYAAKLERDEALIDWRLPAQELALKIGAFVSANVMYTLHTGQRIRLWKVQPDDIGHNTTPGTIISANKQAIQVACGQGSLNILSLQLPGGKVLDSAAILNGRADWFTPGNIFNHD